MRLARLLLVGLLLGSGCLFGTGPASADPLPLGQCTSSSGVILAVDFGHFGGGVYQACGSTPTSGYQLLNQGGWATDGTHTNGPRFVCRIGYSGFNGGTRYPTDFSCGVTPPASAYWAYWHAEPTKNVWVYSQAAATDTSPKAGSVDAWTFGAGSAPSFTPDSMRAHYPMPTSGGGGAPTSQPVQPPPHTAPGPVTAPGSESASADGPAGSGAAATRPAESSGGHSPSARASKPAASATGLSPSSAIGVPSSTVRPSGTAALIDAEPLSPTKQASGNAVDFVVGAVVIMAVLALVGWQFWHRKQASRYS